MSGSKLLRLRLSLKGRPIRTFKFNQDVITVGRNPEADIFLDNQGISREHMKLEMTSRGYYAVEDLKSANGTFLNEQQVEREFLMNNDVIKVGKFTLWANYEDDMRGEETAGKMMSPSAYQGTTVLSTEELEGMMTQPGGDPIDVITSTTPEPEEPSPKDSSTTNVKIVAALWFLAGLSVGSGIAYIILR